MIMRSVSIINTLAGLFAAPPSPDVARVERASWTNPIGFSVTVPPEMTGMMTLDGLTEPRISRAQAIQVPGVKRVRDLIAGTLGTLQPRMIDSDNKPVYSELLEQPEENRPRSITMTDLVEDMLFEKYGWWRITETDRFGYPSKVVRLDPLSVNSHPNGRVYYNDRTRQAQGLAEEWIPDSQLIRFDSPNDPLLVAGATAIRMALLLGRAAMRFTKDPMPLGIFRPRDGESGPGDQKEVDKALDHFEEQRQARAWAYMDGLEAQVLTWSPEQMSLAKQRDYAVLEIARLGGVDPEELGVSTTTRTYANAEQRRLDLIDFTLIAYVTAIEDRLKMKDISLPGHRAVYDYSGFLRSDTLTRLETYALGLELGTYTPERIAEIERIPVAQVKTAIARMRESKTQTPAVPRRRTPAQTGRTTEVVNSMSALTAGADAPAFSSTSDPMKFSFAGSSEVEFKADPESRTVSGMLLPWGVTAYSGGYRWEFAPGSLHWSSVGRVKLDKDHVNGTEFGAGREINNTTGGLSGRFGVSRTPMGDQMLTLAVDGVYDGFSVWIGFESEADGWTEHPEKPGVRLVHSATLRKVALTAMPAFDDARVAHVAATQEGTKQMTAPAEVTGAPQAGAPQAGPDWAAFTKGMTDAFAAMPTAVATAVKEAFAQLPTPQGPGVVKAGVESVVEAPVYRMNGHGPSFVRDTWKARTEGDHEAAERVRKFMAQTKDSAERAMNLEFAVNTGNASGVIAPGYRPDLFVTQLMKGRPLVNSVSRGTLQDATPFNIPAYVSSSNETSQHVEGVNPSGGTLVLGTKTVSPQAISGKFELTREIVDSANPAIDAIAMAAMRESYSQQTEALVYAEINGTNGVGGTITANKVPSGAAARAVTGSAGGAGAGGDELLGAVREAEADFWFDRFGEMDRAHISREATQAYAGAKDSSGRPLLPYVGPQNAVGTSSPNTKGYLVDGVIHQPTWSMTGNAAGDADVVMFSAEDIWAWESGLLMFRYEERNGPAQIDLALFGYFATRILRPQGFTAVRFTVTP